ncbi:extracellular solute-binding protein [Acetobacterium tundrae]|uniref:Extracellular solute-binding protein n=1 Tax=Acetobacterium tundrae TaxID=132932 RepID=A0ABR6WHW4_9FIRM|nr:extracellular solute-binding protein [Acetobacterium tundrae]MBC3796085.1 extracellular solute-binding protein [Acetobacterium tundrae]
MKRKLKAACLVLSMVILLTSCSTAEKSVLDPKNPVSITLWHYYVGDNKIALETAVDQFNKGVGSEKGVVVTAVAKGSISELEKAVTDSAKGIINAEPMPDMFSTYPDKGLEIDQLGKLCDLNDYFSKDEQKLYIAAFLNDGKYDGDRLLSIPIVKSTELLYVNATAWNEFAAATGVNEKNLTTWEGVYAVARAYYQWTDAQTPDIAWDGKSLMGIDSVANYIIIGNKQLGVEVIDGKNEKAVLNHADLRKLFDIYYGGMSLGYLNAVGKFRSDDIKASDLIAYVGSSSGAAYFPTWIEKDNTRSPIEFTALAYPCFAGGTPTAIVQGAGMSVTKSTPEKQEGAALFLKWFTAEEQNIPFAMTTGYLPVETGAYGNADYNASLKSLSSGDQAEKNVAAVYDIALNQIMESNTYASTPFKGSYNVRSVLETSLTTMAESGRQSAVALKEQGMTEDEIVTALDMNARFDEWLSSIRSQFDTLGISYSEE